MRRIMIKSFTAPKQGRYGLWTKMSFIFLDLNIPMEQCNLEEVFVGEKKFSYLFFFVNGKSYKGREYETFDDLGYCIDKTILVDIEQEAKVKNNNTYLNWKLKNIQTDNTMQNQ